MPVARLPNSGGLDKKFTLFTEGIRLAQGLNSV